MHLRTFRADDLEALIDLTVRAFRPIQDGIRDHLGPELFARQNGQWQQDYRDTLTELTGPEHRHRFFVADLDGEPAGYAAWDVHPGPAGPRGKSRCSPWTPGTSGAGSAAP